MAPSDPHSEAVDLFKKGLSLSNVRPRETVAVLSDNVATRPYAEAFLEAIAALGADPVDVNLAASHDKSANEKLANLADNALVGNRQAIEILKNADMVVDLMFMLFSKEQIEIEAAGARILLVVEPLEILQRLFPTDDLRRRVEAAEARLASAKKLRFANDAGTDVSYELGGHRILTEYGFTRTPGRWDHWPGGFLATCATGSVDGRVVMAPGDIVYPWKEFIRQPIEFVIRDGRVVGIDGGQDAKRLKEYMDAYDDPRAFAVSHIGWGLNEKAQWRVDVPGVGMDGRSYYGNVLFSTGPNNEFGGANDTACHLDLPMKDCTLWLDGEAIVKDGAVLPPEMRVSGDIRNG